MEPTSNELLEQINKRFTLNLLIQGAATHTFLTSHHLVKDELDQINPKLTPLYDKLTVSLFLSYWYGDIVLVCGRPAKFWKRVHTAGHPFCQHPLLVRHGAKLADSAKRHALNRAKAKRVSRIPVIQEIEMIWLLMKTFARERRHAQQLADLAKRATGIIWGIDENRLDAELTRNVEFGRLRKPSTFIGRLLRSTAAGYGGVLRHESEFTVVAKAWIWPLVSHELVKGTAELVCLHGLNTLDRETYDQVTHAADKIEYEIWLMQAGSELWRRTLAVLPDNKTLPESLMNIARLCPQELERLMLTVLEQPDRARKELATL